MRKILLTFLGTGKYEPCAYRFDDQVSAPETFFSVALAQSIWPETVVSLQTIAAAEKHGEKLSEDLEKHGIPGQVVKIPNGGSESELWEIFSAITNAVPAECELHLDITHGFRSLPLIGFIALAYLRTTRKVTIGGIHYGAWESRNSDGSIAPVFDITPFLTLLDWNSAADQFLQTGSADRIAQLLSDAQQSLWRNPGDLEKSDLPRALKGLSKSLKEASQSRLLLRTGALKRSAEEVVAKIEEARAEAGNHALPFLELLNPVREQLSRHADHDLDTLRDLVSWLAERGQTAAALTLASEWLISWVMVSLGETTHFTDEKHRKPYADCLNLIIDRSGKSSIENPSPESEKRFDDLTSKVSAEVIDLVAVSASQIKVARNDLNHAGFRKQPMPPGSIHDSATSIGKNLGKIPLPSITPAP